MVRQLKVRGHKLRGLAGASTGAILAALAVAPAAYAQQAVSQFDVPQQPLSQGLLDFGRQASISVAAPQDLVAGKTGAAVKGNLSTEMALNTLLSGTGLEARFVGPNAARIVQAGEGGSGPQRASAGGDVDALIVTAQKKEENIQDVPIAISAFSQQDLTNRQVAGGPDLITQVPNMTFTKTNFSSYSVQLRGIGTQAISATTDPAVAVAFNNTPFIRNRFFEQEFYDLQRIEVLRGPQGTLYGRNATAGVVNIISAKPRFVYEAKASGDVSNFNSSRLEGMANIPLLEDKAALRLAGAWTKRDGYATNELTGNPIDGRDLWSTRVSLRVAPTDGIDVNLIWEHFEEEDDRLRSGKQLCKKDVVTNVGGVDTPNYFQLLPDRGQSSIIGGVQATFSQGCARESLYSQDSFQTPNGLMLPYYVPLGSIGLPTQLLDPYVTDQFGQPQLQTPDLRVIQSTIDPDYRASTDIGELQISLDLGHGLTLQSETAYSTDSVYSLQDFNRFNTAPGAWDDTVTRPDVLEDGFFCDPQLGCSDRLVAVDVSTAKARQFSQEFRLSSDYDGPLNFSLGANYLRADSEDKYYVFINSLSLIAASSITATETQGPYVQGESDNISCMLNGYLPGDPDGVYSVVGCNYMDPNPIGSVNDEGHNYFLSKNPYKLISYAVFGELYYDITESLKLTGGLRWTVDKKDAPRIPTWILASNSVGYPVAEVIQQDWSEPTGRLTLDWRPDFSFTDETMLYASFAHGYKAGGANPPGYVRIFYSDLIGAADSAADSATRPKTFEPEFVDAFEIGAKNTFADGRVTMNLAAFYYDYKDYQISEIVDRSAFNRNFDATVWGIEIETDWRAMDNLRLGFKGGYEKTRIADGERAIDLMDRTAGEEGWVVVRPFPTYASSCVLPEYVFIQDGVLKNPGGVSGGNPSACEIAYQMGLDPVTYAPYGDITDPNQFPNPFTGYTDYEGFDPLDESQGHNGGEGFFKQLGGNELPNAPEFTATITVDYTLPLPKDWLATLHTDLHWQSESWWRVFNDHEFGKLDEYFTMNFAAIFTNEEAGWNIMAYVKNVTDETAITGAFLNSDDTGLTTNVFLTEPRLYGVRVTKAWTGASPLGSFGERHEGPYPFTLELGGQVQRHDAPNEYLRPTFADAFQAPLDIFDDAQEQELDWGDGREAKLTWRPGGDWNVSAAVRYGKTNGRARPSAEDPTDRICAFGGYYESFCTLYVDHYRFGPFTDFSIDNRADASVRDREEHQIVDFAVGREVGLGGQGQSNISLGLRYAQFKSSTDAELRGVPDWNVPAGFYPGLLITHTVYDIRATAQREFRGAGPTISWEAAYPLAENDLWGRIDLDWSLNGGVLFGTQKTEVTSEQEGLYTVHTPFEFILAGSVVPPIPTTITSAPVSSRRSEDTVVPNVAATLGLSYSVGGFKVGGGYRWERYFDAIDGGYTQRGDYDRTIDGPYFKVSVGFGG